MKDPRSSAAEKIAAAVLYTLGLAVALFAVIAIFAVSGFGAVSAIIGLFAATDHVASAVALSLCCLVAAGLSLYCMVLIFICAADGFQGKRKEKK